MTRIERAIAPPLNFSLFRDIYAYSVCVEQQDRFEWTDIIVRTHVLSHFNVVTIADQTGDWNVSMFLPCVFFYVTGAIVYVLYGSSDPVDFDA